MRIAHWGFLLLLALIPLLHRWWSQRNRPARIKFPLGVPAAASQGNPLRRMLLVRYLGLALLIVALARPQVSFKQTQRSVSGIDIVMVMDFSASMNIEDLSERSRIDIAKEVMEKFIKGRSNDRIGFVAFSGEPVTLSPPTLDYGLLLKAMNDWEIGSLKDGTAIGDGLAVAVSRLKNSKARSRVVILLTDGDNNVGQVDPATAGDLALGYGIRVYTIAIGREGRVNMPIRTKGPMGSVRTTYQTFENALNPELLMKIAEQTKGKFYRVVDEGALNRVFEEIDRLERTEIKVAERVRYDEAFEPWLKVGLLILLLAQLAFWSGRWLPT